MFAVLLLGLLNTMAGLLKLARSIAKPGVRVGDFSAFLNGWHLARSGSSTIYDVTAQANTISQRSGARWASEEFPLFVNPPHVALMGWPLGNSSLPFAFGIMALVSVAALVILSTWVWLATRPLRRVDRVLSVGAVLSTPALLYSFRLGSFALIVAAGVVTVASSAAQVLAHPGVASARSSACWAWVGAVGVVAISIKPQYLVVIAAALLGLRAWPILGRATILLGVLTAAATALLGWRVWGDYLHLLESYSAMSGRHGLDVTTMINVRSVLARTFGVGTAVDQVATVLWVASAVAIFVAVRRLANRQPNRHPSQFCPAATTVIVCVSAAVAAVMSPHANVQDVLIAAPAAVCLIAYRPSSIHRIHNACHVMVRVVVTLAPVVALVNGPLPNARTLAATAFVIAIGGASMLGPVRPAETRMSSSVGPTNRRDAEDSASPVRVLRGMKPGRLRFPPGSPSARNA